MITKAGIESLIVGALREAIRDRVGGAEMTISESTPLFGREAHVESLELVSMIVGVETALFESHGLELCLADDRALTRAKSPFSSVGSLRDYILELAQESG